MDYKKLGFKAGLEIHQQLDTGKLFSRTPSYLRKDPPHFKIKRKLHKVAGETGEVDIAVEHEASQDKEFTYEGYNDTISLVELDESPPREIDQNALDIALQISLLLNCEIVPITQIMRKTVVDGSNTSGFQRTVLIAKDGFIDTSFGTVGIWYVYLEEDSARKISEDNKRTTFRLDRLGIPLVEIVTAPDITTPEQVKETALKIGEILRATKVKRGLGTIRQDINITIKNHPRAEIKGFQDPKFFITVVEKEIQRQEKNIIDKKEVKEEVRGGLDSGETKFLRPLPSKARMYPETDLPILKIPKQQIDKIKKNLPKLKTEIKQELKKKGLSEELINLILPDHLDEFQTLLKVYNKDPPLIAKMITLWRSKQTERVLEQILEALSQEKIEKSEVKEIMKKIAEGKKFEEAILSDKVSHNELEEEINKLVKANPDLTAKAYMGIIMKKFKGKVDAKKTMDILKKLT